MSDRSARATTVRRAVSVPAATLSVVVTWKQFTDAGPDLAEQVRATFAVRRHAVMATLRRDGSPRLSGTEVDFSAPGGPTIAMPADSVKAGDLRRDARVALHCPTLDPPERDAAGWSGDGKIAGRAVPVSAPPLRGAVAFRVDISEVVWTGIATAGDHLLIRSWHPDRGLRERRRT